VETSRPSFLDSFLQSTQKAATAAILGLALLSSSSMIQMLPNTAAYAATDPSQIVGCLFQKCPVPLGKCVLNPKCLANVVCINTCNGRPDEIECQIKCGDIFENPVVGEFNSEYYHTIYQEDGWEDLFHAITVELLTVSFSPVSFRPLFLQQQNAS